MPVTKSAIKAMKQANAANLRNKAVKADFRIKVKNVKKAVEAGSKDLGKLVSTAVQAIDKAAKRGVIHENAASRRKSRLMSLVNKKTEKVVIAESIKEKSEKPAKKTSSKSTTKKASK